MALTEEQLREAEAELHARDEARRKRYADEHYRQRKEAEDRFWARMQAQYPALTRDEMHDIYGQCRDFYE